MRLNPVWPLGKCGRALGHRRDFLHGVHQLLGGYGNLFRSGADLRGRRSNLIRRAELLLRSRCNFSGRRVHLKPRFLDASDQCRKIGGH